MIASREELDYMSMPLATPVSSSLFNSWYIFCDVDRHPMRTFFLSSIASRLEDQVRS
jgi:hypothetical protein